MGAGVDPGTARGQLTPDRSSEPGPPQLHCTWRTDHYGQRILETLLWICLQTIPVSVYNTVCLCAFSCHFDWFLVSVHRSASLCLSQALLKCPLPKSIISNSSWDFVGVTEGPGPATLKETLISWLLMTDQSDEMEDISKPHPIICRLTQL